jgi:flagellar hook assembly protein FlgD
MLKTTNGGVGVEEERAGGEGRRANSLLGSSPNPFTKQTLIRYQLASPEKVRLAVYNIAGQRVKTLAAEVRPAGAYQVVWSGHDDSGRRLPSGIYLLRFKAGSDHALRQIVLIR